MQARSPAQHEQSNIFCFDHLVVISSVQDVQLYTAWNPPICFDGELNDVHVEKNLKTSPDFLVIILSVPITLLGRAIKALVDTAAMVTIIFDEIHRGMNPNRPCLKFTSLETVGKDMNMSGFVVHPLQIK